MKRAVQFAFFLIILGSSAIAAHAQTSEDLSSLLGDPTISVRSPDPCPGCVDLTWTGTPPMHPSQTTFFFAVSGYPPSGVVIPPDYSCVVDPSSTNPINCNALTMLIGGEPEFIGVNLIVYNLTDLETFGFSATGGGVTLVVPPDSGLSCNPSTPCVDDRFFIGTTPEPGTALLYMTGIVFFLIGFARKRFRVSFRT